MAVTCQGTNALPGHHESLAELINFRADSPPFAVMGQILNDPLGRTHAICLDKSRS